jgi:hypothetical protein
VQTVVTTASQPGVADRVALVPDQHRGPLAVEDQVAGIQVILEHRAAGVRRDDHPDNGQFFLAELADLAGRVSHRAKSSIFAAGTS